MEDKDIPDESKIIMSDETARGYFSYNLLRFFSFLSLLFGIGLCIYFFNQASSIETKFSFQTLTKVQQGYKSLYVFYAVTSLISGFFTFFLLNVINAIYAKLYQDDL